MAGAMVGKSTCTQAGHGPEPAPKTTASPLLSVGALRNVAPDVDFSRLSKNDLRLYRRDDRQVIYFSIYLVLIVRFAANE